MSEAGGLARLEERLATDLLWLEYPSKSWVPPRFVDGERVLDVLIVGAGMAGLAASVGLKRLGIDNHVLFDRAGPGLEGPWITYARMETLRSPKGLTGPAMGLPALTFRAYYEARFGRAAWDALDKIPRTLWMEYLVWYRHALDLPVENETEVLDVAAGEGGLLRVTTTHAGRTKAHHARHLVLATGRDGLGGPYVPPFARDVDRKFWAHTADDIDFARLARKRVAVIGAGASAIDNAATALEAGVARLDLLIRRADMPRVNTLTGIGSKGVVHGFSALPDTWKWRFLDYATRAQTPPPRDSTRRVSRHANAYFHFSSPILSFAKAGDHVVIQTPKGRYEVDFVILGTGFRVDLASRPELARFADHIMLWSDGHLPDGARNKELANSPYLDEAFEFIERETGSCPALRQIHCFNFPATLSHGKLTGDIPAISEGAERLAQGLARRLFVADRDTHYRRLEAYNVPELHGDEWTDADATNRSDAA